MSWASKKLGWSSSLQLKRAFFSASRIFAKLDSFIFAGKLYLAILRCKIKEEAGQMGFASLFQGACSKRLLGSSTFSFIGFFHDSFDLVAQPSGLFVILSFDRIIERFIQGIDLIRRGHLKGFARSVSNMDREGFFSRQAFFN